MKPLPYLPLGLVYALVLAIITVNPIQAQIFAGFNDGETTSSVDGWTGLAGAGWAHSWQTNTATGASITPRVINTQPLAPGHGHYLSVISRNTSTELSRRTLIRRQYQGHGQVSMSEQHTVSFMFRIDSGLDSISTMHFFDTDSNGSAAPNASTAWHIRDMESGGQRYWNFRHTDNTSVATAVQIYETDTYLFLLNLDPEHRIWTGTITNLDHAAHGRTGNATFTSDDLGFNSSSSQIDTIGGYLHWNVTLAAASEGQPSETTWSLDTISVNPIPESSTYAFLAGAAALLFVIGCRRLRSSVS